MRTATAWVTALAASIAIATAAHGQALQALDVVQRAAEQNAGLQSYTARATFDVDLHAFVTIHPTLHATYYYKHPDKAEVVFDTMPVLAEQFQHLYAALATADKWPTVYNIRFSAAPAPGKPYELTMTPKKEGNVDRVLVTIDPQTFAITRMEWRYENGSWIDMQQTNGKVGSFVLPVGQVGDFNLPSYKAHAVASYSEYHINVPIPDSVFTK